MDALFRGDIDLYPEYDTLRGSDGRRGVAWLASAPMDASPCLATSQYAAEAYWLLTLETCAAIAPKLRLAAGADFLAAAGGLQRLQRAYGRFRFKRVLRVEAGRQYDLLSRGDADVAAAYTTDARMAEKQLIILGDTKHVWPRGTLAPVIRTGSLRAHPQAGSILNRVSKTVTTYAVQQMNMRRELLYMTPRDVAEGFLDAHRALTLR
jgi:glycine betaine/choline ABC-type transport system substrate-binding protein